MAIPIEQGIFINIGDEYVLQLDPITDVLTFDSFDEHVAGILVDRIFTREFRFSKNGAPFTAYAPLTNVNLQAIVAIKTDTWDFEIRYTRAGVETAGTLNWVKFILDSVTVSGCLIMKINKANWDALYGTSKFDEIDATITKFNVFSIEEFGQVLLLADDAAVADLQIAYITDGDYVDLIDLLSTEWGNRLITDMFGIRVDLFDGIRS